MRLQKYLSEVGFCSRRDAEDLISAGKIVVDGTVATLGDKVLGHENIVIDGKELVAKELPTRKVLVFFKPAGVECTLAAINGLKTLLDFDFGSDRVFPVGHLDRESSGLLLLTNDGDLANKLTQPSRKDEDEYLLVVEGDVTPAMVVKLSQAIMEAHKASQPCLVEHVGGNRLQITLHNGRSRQIRKSCEDQGVEISDLLRLRVGKVGLEDLEVGGWRILSAEELQLLR